MMAFYLIQYIITETQSKYERQQGSGNDTIKYHTLPRIQHGEVPKIRININNKSQEVSPFPAGDHKAAMNRRKSMRNTRHTLNINDPLKKYRLGTVSKIFYWRA